MSDTSMSCSIDMLLKQLDGTHVRTVDGEQWRSSRSRQAVIEQLTVTRRAWVSSNCKSEPVRITQHPSHYGKTIRGGTQKVRPASWPAMHERHTIVCLSFHPMAKEHVHGLKGLACRKRVAAASSPAATCKQGVVITSPARHACGCARPLSARLGHKNSKI